MHVAADSYHNSAEMQGHHAETQKEDDELELIGNDFSNNFSNLIFQLPLRCLLIS